LLDHAGLLTHVGLCPIQVHEVSLCDQLFKTATVLRAGDLWLFGISRGPQGFITL
jgi:hypothetical protein